ncbi:MAG: phosphotransferase [Saccharospirillum sp.]
MNQALTHVLDQLTTPISARLSVKRRPGGLCNRLYRLHSHEGAFALRVNHPGSAQLGVDRVLEQRVLAAIAGQDWSPEVLECASGWLLSRWVDGVTPARGERVDLPHLTTLMQSVHTVEVEGPVLNMAVRLQALLDAGPAWPEPALEGVQALLAAYRLPDTLCLCHHDWHPGNVLVQGERWVLLDWEYAALGDPAMDVAAAWAGFDLSSDQAEALADALTIDTARLHQAKAMMEAIALAWHGVWPDLAAANLDSPMAWWQRWIADQ